MTRSLVSIAAGLAAALVLPAVALAQSTPRPPAESADRPVAVAADSAVARAKPAARASVTYAALSSALTSLPEQSSRFAGSKHLRSGQITLVDVRNLFRNRGEQEHYEESLERYDRQIAEMRTVLQGSAPLREMLKERGLRMSQVVGVQTTPDGRAVVFYQPE